MPVVVITDPAAYKCGSTWTFVLTRKDATGTPIDLTGLAVRSMFRQDSAAGPVIVTLTDAGGIAVDAALGQVVLTLTPTQTALFVPGSKAVFDVEMTRDGYAWQSDTYKFKTEQEVTRG
jgi:hypothetical protein